MPRVKIGLQIEETSPLVRHLIGSGKGVSEWDGIDPDEIVKVTYTVESSDIQEINPGIYYNIPSITTAKQGDTLFSDDGRLFVYDEAGSRWFLWYTFDNATAKIHTNNTLKGEGTLDNPLSVNATVVALKGDLNPLLEGVDNGDGTYTFTSVDGSNSFTIPSSLAALGIFEEDSDFIISDIYRNRYIISTAVESQTVTIPSDTTENLEVGYAVTITSKNGECVKIVPEKGVTVNNEESNTNLISKGGKIKLVKEGPNEWGLYGDFKKVPIGYNRKRLVLTRSEVSTDTIYWLQVYKSSEWPKFNIQSDYFVLWSTDHANPAASGEIRWGECDDPLLNNFVDRGRIVGGNQAETPWLMKIPVGESSFTNNEYFLFYHTDMSDPDNIPGFQETHLITTDGGDEPHLCTWTPPIKPLGNDGTENHTGYFTAFRRGPGDYVGMSVVCTPGTIPACAKLSTASDPASWTRGAVTPFVSNIDGSFARAYSHYPVQYGGTTYGISRFFKNNGEQWVVLSELDNNFQPIRVVKYLFTHPQVRIFSIYEEAGNIYILFKGGVDNSDPLHDYYSYVVKLSDVGNLRSSTINFDGVDGLLKSDNNTLFDLKFPIILRFTPTSVGDFDILGKGIRGAADNRWFVSYIAGEFGLTTRLLQSGPATAYRFPYVLNAGEWYEYSAEIDPNTGDLVQYINGVEQRRDANPSISIVSTEFFLELGVVTGGSIVNYFQGSVDYLRIGEEEFDFTENYGYSTTGSQGHYLYLKGGVSWGSCTIQQRLELGDAYTDAFKGNLGKIAYEHSQLTSGNPHNVTASEVGLGNVDNTSDADKPVSTAQGLAINQAEADAKQYTDDEITALNLGSASQSDVGDFATAAQGSLADTALQPGDNISDLTNDSGFVDSAGAASAAPVQSVNSQTGSVVLDADDIDDAATTNKFVTAAEKSDIASAVQPGDLATVATTGAYSDLSGTPTLGTAAAADTGDFATAAQGSLADTAVQPGDLSAVATSGQSTDLTDSTDLVRNDQDTYVSEPKVVQIITLTQAEKDAIVTPIEGALYIIPEA